MQGSGEAAALTASQRQQLFMTLREGSESESQNVRGQKRP